MSTNSDIDKKKQVVSTTSTTSQAEVKKEFKTRAQSSENKENRNPEGRDFKNPQNRDNRRRFARNNRGKRGDRRKGGKKREISTENEFESKVIEVRRVTRVVKGGKRMRFSALVVVGNRDGKIGYAIKKGLDYQDAVNKATRKARTNLIIVKVNDNLSLPFESKTKYKSAVVYLKPAKFGTGTIAGGYVRPILDLAGIKNIYSKIVRSRNKIAGTQVVFEALKKYSAVKTETIPKPEIVK